MADVDSAQQSCWQLRLLGGFDLRSDGVPVLLAGREARLVALLALQCATVTRELVAATLWGPAGHRNVAGSLRTAVWRVGLAAPGLIVKDRCHLALHEQVEVDVRRARNVAASLTTDPDPAVPPHTIALLEHDLLPGWYDDWVVVEHERFRQSRVHALEAAARALSAEGRHAQAVDAARLAVAAEPLRESAHRAVIEAHLADGDPGAAWRQFHRCRRILTQEFGLEPSAELARLVASSRGRVARPVRGATPAEVPYHRPQ